MFNKRKQSFHGFFVKVIATIIICGGLSAALAADGAESTQKTFKLGIIGLLSGPAAKTYGEPVERAAHIIVDALNEGTVPTPYNSKGIGGMSVELRIADSSPNAIRSMAERHNMDAIVSGFGSGDCLAQAPVAENLKVVTIFSSCGTPRLFEEGKYQYVFRTGMESTQDVIGAVRYLIDEKVTMRSVSGINSNYAYGRDAWDLFIAVVKQLSPKTIIKDVLWPSFGAPQYGTEISTLLRDPADVTFTSFWGGDAVALALQGAPRNLFKNTNVVFYGGANALPELRNKIPDGVIMGERGATGNLAPDNELNRWFINEYKKRYNEYPYSSSAYNIIQAVLAIKSAADENKKKNRKSATSSIDLARALENLEWETPSGEMKMIQGGGHQALQDAAFGKIKWNAEKGIMEMVDVRYYSPTCIAPKNDIKSLDWINQGMPGAKCD